jgi:leucyl/phenylalanyl-tRNA--protein transferase
MARDTDMHRTPFPDPSDSTDPDGLIAIGGDLSPATLLAAYRQGIFPWPIPGLDVLPWFSPPQRAILDFSELHIPRRLARRMRTTDLRFTIDRAFPEVIQACRQADRPGQAGTWITDEMERAYCRLHKKGIAHSVEAWDAEGQLVGGLYGVDAGGAFSGESMFHVVPDASKLALLALLAHFQACGLDFIDIQQLTPHMAVLGAREVPRALFFQRWKAALAQERHLFPEPREINDYLRMPVIV